MRVLFPWIVALSLLSAGPAQILPEDVKTVSDREAELGQRIEALRRIGLARIDKVDEFFPVVLPLLRDETEEAGIRALAAQLLAGSVWSNFENSLRLREVVPDLVTCLETDVAALSQTCAEALSFVRPSIPEGSAPSLLELLPRLPQPSLLYVLPALGRLDHEVAREASGNLLDRLGQNPDPQGIMDISEQFAALGAASPEAVRFLIEQLSSDQPEVVSRVALALPALGKDALAALAPLRRQLARKNLSPDARLNLEAAVEQLERIATRASKSPNDWLQVASDSRRLEPERREALQELREVPAQFDSVLDFVSRLFSTPRAAAPGVSVAALEMLDSIVFNDFNRAPGLLSLAPKLSRCVLEEEDRLQKGCAATLALVRPALSLQDAEPLLSKLEGEGQTDLEVQLIEALRRVDSLRPRLNEILVGLLERATAPKLLAAASRALQSPANGALAEKAVAALEPLIRHYDSEVQAEAIRALARLGSRARMALPSLRSLQQKGDSDETIRRLCDLAVRMILRN